MMHHTKPIFSAIILALIFLLAGTGCTGPADPLGSPTGTLRLSVKTAASRTIESGIDATVAKFVVTLVHQTNTSLDPVSFDMTGTTSPDQTLAVGTWDVTVDSVNAAEQTIDSGTSTLVVTAGTTVSCTVALTPADGNGSASLTFTWPAMVANAYLYLDLIASDDSSTSQTLVYSGTPCTQAVWTRTGDLVAGYYRLSARLVSGEGSVTPLYTWTDQLRVAASQTTTATIAFQAGTDLYHLAMPEMVAVTGGTFSNGTADVTVSDFNMGKYEVTQGQYLAVMGSNPSNFAAYADAPARPVEMVSWYDAIVFCNKLSLLEGKTPVYSINGSTDPDLWDGTDDETVTVPTSSNTTWDTVTMDMTVNGYRLPTEAEWEFAARGGNSSHGYAYSGSDTVGDVAWYVDNSGSTTHTTGTKLANELGLYDMSGNVWEWCQDWYGDYSTSAQTDPMGAASGTGRVLRGASYGNDSSGCTIAYRVYSGLDGRGSFFGFRIVNRTVTATASPTPTPSTETSPTPSVETSPSPTPTPTAIADIVSANIGTLKPVTGGTFYNGTADVTLSTFYMSQYEITQTQYTTVMGSNPSYFTAVTNGPVEVVSWYTALVFCNKLSILESKTPVYTINGSTDPSLWGTVPTAQDAVWDAAIANMAADGYRLPTEAEWEFAARGGTASLGNTYAGSNTVDEVAWYSANDGTTTMSVGGKLPNELGLYDMSGNVSEWCQDWYGDYSAAVSTDPTGTAAGSYRVIRGGNYGYDSTYATVAARSYTSPYRVFHNVGVRVVCRPASTGTGGITITPVNDTAFTVSILSGGLAVSGDGTLGAGTNLSLSATTTSSATVSYEWYLGTALIGSGDTLTYGSSLLAGRYYTIKLIGTSGTTSSSAQYRFKVE